MYSIYLKLISLTCLNNILLLLGTHDATTFASIILDYLKKFKVTQKLSAMTADNVGTNAAIGRKISMLPEITFDHTTQVHGCVAHVINLAAKEGLKEFDEVVEFNEGELHLSSMDVRNLVDPPDGHLFDLKTIYARCHRLVKATRSSPQRAQAFANVVSMVQQLAITLEEPKDDTQRAAPRLDDPQDIEAIEYMQNDFNYEDNQAGPKPRGGAANRLVPDVPTRWNSSYLMF